jgi:MFS family permease
MSTQETPEVAGELTPLMERNLRLLGWWWWLRVFWLGEAIWVVYLTEEHGLTVGQVLLFEAAYAGTVLLSEVPTGIIADRYGRRRALLIGGVGFMAGLVAFGLGTGVVMLIVAYATMGFSDATISGADSAILYDSLEPLERTEEFEPRLGRLNASLMIGFGAMTIAGALMVRWTPLSAPILLSSLLTLPSIFIVVRMHEPPRSGVRSSVRAIGSGALKRIVTTRSMWSVVLLNTVTTLSIVLVAIIQQPVLLEFGFPIWSLGLFVAAQNLVGAGGSWISGAAGRRLGLPVLFLVVPLVSAGCLLAGTSEQPWMYAFFVLPAAGFHLVFPHASGFLARRVGDGERATVISMASMVSSSATVAVTPLVGLLVDSSGLDTALVVASLGLATVALLAYLAWWTSGDVTRGPSDAPPPSAEELLAAGPGATPGPATSPGVEVPPPLVSPGDGS